MAIGTIQKHMKSAGIRAICGKQKPLRLPMAIGTVKNPLRLPMAIGTIQKHMKSAGIRAICGKQKHLKSAGINPIRFLCCK